MTTEKSIKKDVLSMVMKLSKNNGMPKEKKEALLNMLTVIYDFILTDRTKGKAKKV